MNKDKHIFGFTLVELMIAVAIVGILASIAYPSYTNFVARSNRSEPQRELKRLANLEEQLYVDSRAYTADLTLLGVANPYITPSRNYSITAVAGATTFTLTATALLTQATNDSACPVLTITETGRQTPTSCWEN